MVFATSQTMNQRSVKVSSSDRSVHGQNCDAQASSHPYVTAFGIRVGSDSQADGAWQLQSDARAD
jgi:hypothetical protein